MMLRLDRVVALAILALAGCDRKSHLLSDGARQEPAYRMRLPAGGFLQLFGCGSVRPLQQFQDLGSLTAIPCGSALLFALSSGTR